MDLEFIPEKCICGLEPKLIELYDGRKCYQCPKEGFGGRHTKVWFYYKRKKNYEAEWARASERTRVVVASLREWKKRNKIPPHNKSDIY